MGRKKVYEKKQILIAAQEILKTKGMPAITARSVAQQMRTSTQPIYLEFENMVDLKKTLLDMSFEQIENKYFQNQSVNNEIVDFGLNFCSFATGDVALFNALFLYKHSLSNDIERRCYMLFKKINGHNAIDDELWEKVHQNILVAATGLSALAISGVVDLPDEKKEALFSSFVK